MIPLLQVYRIHHKIHKYISKLRPTNEFCFFEHPTSAFRFRKFSKEFQTAYCFRKSKEKHFS